MRIGFFWLGCGVAAFCTLASPARAQQWLSDRARAEGRGILVGTLELHPGIGAEIGYDNNVFLASDEFGEKPESSAILRLSPSFYVSTLSGERLQGQEPKLNLRAGVTGSFRHYFATSQGTDMGVGEDAKLTWHASKVFALDLFQDYKRSIEPFTEPGGPLGRGKTIFDRDQLGGGTRLQLSTPGALLKGGVGYRIDWDSFESTAFDANDSLTHTASADTSWEFLPKTAILWNGSFARHLYLHEDTSALGERNDSSQVSNKLGLNGALTPRISFTLAAGYDVLLTDGDAGSDSEAITAQVEGRWRVLEATMWTLGYDRTLRPSFQGNSMRADRIKTSLASLLWGAFVLGAKVEFTFVTFGDDPSLARADNPDGSRSDKHLLTNLSAEYRFVDWFAVTGEVGYLRNFTDFVVDVRDTAGNTTPDAAKYQRFEAWLGVRAFL